MAQIDDIIFAEQKRLESVLRAAFKAGEDSARHSILAMLSDGSPTSGSDEKFPSTGEDRQRAPKGLPRKLVQRVLKDNNLFGSTPQDIVDAAITDDEKMIAVSTIRGELRKGKGEGRYTDEGGTWKLVSDIERLKEDDDLDNLV